MRLVSFDPFRSLHIPGCEYIKPELMYRHLDRIAAADWLLFPEYWQVNTLHYVLGKRLFPSIATYHLGHDKIEQTRALWAACPAHVPLTLILPNTDSARENVLETLAYPFVAKDPRNSMGRGVYLIQNSSDFAVYCANAQVLYVQEYLPITRDLRLVVIGQQVVAGYWRVQEQGGFHTNVAQGGSIEHADIPADAIALVERVARKLGVNHAGFDVAVVDGHYYFFEFNPMFGNQGLTQQGLEPGHWVMKYLSEVGTG